MLTGQAVGTIAALASARRVQPRELDPRQVQGVLLDSGCTLVQRWYADVPWGTPIWRATQLLTLWKIIDRPGPIDKDNSIPLGSRARWGVDEPLQMPELQSALAQLFELKHIRRDLLPLPKGETLNDGDLRKLLAEIDPGWAKQWNQQPADAQRVISAGEFALLAAKILLLPPVVEK
jgi:hypothetical protein